MVQKAADNNVPSISRREFLSYLLLGSSGLLMAEGVGLGLWYGLPKFNPKNQQMGDIFEVTPAIPLPGGIPVDIREAQAWLVHLENGGIIIFDMICPHTTSGLYKWVEANQRFECPRCGSKFKPDDTYVEGPSQRNLDRYAVTLFTSKGGFKNNAEGDPIFLPANATVEKIHINTGKIILGASRG